MVQHVGDFLVILSESYLFKPIERLESVSFIHTLQPLVAEENRQISLFVYDA
jgi:hypothetical protein